MKKIFILIISFYQKIISPGLHQLFGINSGCRFSETCSDYAKSSILKHGVFKGSAMSFVRILKCQPYYTER